MTKAIELVVMALQRSDDYYSIEDLTFVDVSAAALGREGAG